MIFDKRKLDVVVVRFLQRLKRLIRLDSVCELLVRVDRQSEEYFRNIDRPVDCYGIVLRPGDRVETINNFWCHGSRQGIVVQVGTMPGDAGTWDNAVLIKCDCGQTRRSAAFLWRKLPKEEKSQRR